MKSTDTNTYCVYIHTNKINGKKYVGQTCNLYERWRGNGKNYFNSIKFFNAIKKYGWDNFYHEVIQDNLNKEAADRLEKELIEKYDTINTGYNLKTGGSRGYLSEESLRKMSNSLKEGYKKYPERKEKIRQKRLGKKSSPEANRKNMLNRDNIFIININGEEGSIRYWARRMNMTHPTLLDKKNKYGVECLIKYIRKKLNIIE